MNKAQEIIGMLQDETFVFIFSDREYVVDPSEYFPIDNNDLSEEFTSQPSLYAYIAVLTAKAEATMKLTKLELEELEATVNDRIRTELNSRGEKYTEKVIDNKVTIDFNVKALKRKLLKAQAELGMLKEFEETVRMRAEMLIRQGAMVRAEMSLTDMHLNASVNGREALAAARQRKSMNRS